VCWSTSPNPTTADNTTSDGTGAGSFASALTGLTADTTYFVRAYSTNSEGTSYGQNVSFTTQYAENQITDLDGNIYNIIQIDTQEWLVENLKTTRYANGDPIANETDGTLWNGLTTGGWAHYNNDSQYDDPYGKLYNWLAAGDPRGLCPNGWRVPDDGEWTTLTEFLGGESVAGGALKETGTVLWNSPNTDATNSSGFSGLAGGVRFGSNADFYDFGNKGLWWTSTYTNFGSARMRSVAYNSGSATRDLFLQHVGLSIRCLRN
jgi:uncharacterized protein (TIGR02145 family)